MGEIKIWIIEVKLIKTQKNIRIPVFVAALCIIAKIWKQPKVSGQDNYGTFYLL